MRSHLRYNRRRNNDGRRNRGRGRRSPAEPCGGLPWLPLFFELTDATAQSAYHRSACPGLSAPAMRRPHPPQNDFCSHEPGSSPRRLEANAWPTVAFGLVSSACIAALTHALFFFSPFREADYCETLPRASFGG